MFGNGEIGPDHVGGRRVATSEVTAAPRMREVGSARTN
jgi:hypothetical protein